MMDYKSRELLDSAYNRARGMAIAFIGSLFVLAVVVEWVSWFVPFTGFLGPEDDVPAEFRYVMLIIGVSDLVFLPFFRQKLLSNPTSRTQPSALINRLMTVTILSLAISLAPAVIGVVIFLLWGNRWFFYPLWLVSLVFLLFYFPRQSFWEEWVVGGGRMEP